MNDASRSVVGRRVKFGDVVRQVKNSTKDPGALGIDRVVGLDHLDPGSLEICRWEELKDLSDGTSFTRVFRRGQVLFGKRRAYQRKVAVANFDGICSGDILVFEPATDELDADFLPYVVQSNGFFDHALGTSAGSLSPRTKWQELAKYEFVLPPTSEQKRVVSALRAATEVVAGYERLLGAVETHRAALSASVWQLTTEASDVDELADVTVGIVVKPAALYVKGDGVPALRSLNVLPNRLHEEELVRISYEGHQKHSKSRLVGGEVVVVRTGRPGDTAVIPKDGVERNAIDLLIVRCGESVEAQYLACYLNSLEGRKQMLGRSAGTAQQHLNARQLQRVRVPLVDLSEQKRLVRSMEASDRVRVAATNAKTAALNMLVALRETLLGGGH